MDNIFIILCYVAGISGLFALYGIFEACYLWIEKTNKELDNIRKCAYNKRIKWALRIKRHG
jgi:hypothetical protein